MPAARLPGVSTFTIGTTTVVLSSAESGDFALTSDGVDGRRRLLIGDRPVLFAQQVHGCTVVVDGSSRRGGALPLLQRPDSGGESVRVHTVAHLVVSDDPGRVGSGGAPVQADGVVVSTPGVAASVITADCAPVVMWTDDGVSGAAHAGWRGLVAGVIEATASEICARSEAPHTLQALLGPCIGPCCYEFGSDDLNTVADAYGDGVRSRTTTGSASLDLRAGVAEAVRRSGGVLRGSLGGQRRTDAPCTACGPNWFSWRRDHDQRRQAIAIWSER